MGAHHAEISKTFEKMHAHRTFDAYVHTGWESRYFSEGRDALAGKSLWNSSLELGYDHFSGGVWYGRSSDHRYDELQYSLAITQEIRGLRFYAGYTYLVFQKDYESDDEWSVGISYVDLPFSIGTTLDAYYSNDATGTFIEWNNFRNFEITEEISLYLSGSLGWNEGYVSEGHDGLNHFALRSGIQKPLNEQLSVVGHGSYSWAINRDLSLPGDTLLKNFFHIGLGFEWDL